MPTKTSSWWRNQTFNLFRDFEAQGKRLVATDIARQLEGIARRDSTPPEERVRYPAERTVRTLRQEYEKLPREDQTQFGWVRWPDSFEDGSLPWEAAPAVLELLRLKAGQLAELRYEWPFAGAGGHWEAGRPDVRLAAAFWRVTQAAPRHCVECRLSVAELLEQDSWLARRIAEERLLDKPECPLGDLPGGHVLGTRTKEEPNDGGK
ncbi:MAG TPA: hypothetical protein VNL92_01510 [Dehalococcoidia bacterium]|nr:hypothetical protein [Dehalococcoidia bacterium]